MELFQEFNTSLFIHILSTALMTGVIWTIQLVHYPSFHFINPSVYEKFQKFHMARISYLVMPLMIVELLTGFLLLFLTPSATLSPNSYEILMLNFILILLIWLSTFLLSVPCHAKLEKGYNLGAANKLVSTNWIRTALWSVRLIVLYYWFL